MSEPPLFMGSGSTASTFLIAFEDDYAEAEDPEVLARATELGRVAFTNDDDFLAVANEWLKAGRQFAGVVYVHQLRRTVGQTIADPEVIAKVGTPEDFLNRIEYLPI